jgi:lipoate-protein ligase A
LATARACESYRVVHEALAEALREVGIDVRSQDEGCRSAVDGAASTKKLATTCFEQAEKFDVVRADDGRKIAGAAQKRTKRGLLFQGSVNRLAVGKWDAWEKLAEIFAQKIGVKLGARPEQYFGLPWPEALVAETTARFAAKDWNEKR